MLYGDVRCAPGFTSLIRPDNVRDSNYLSVKHDRLLAGCVELTCGPSGCDISNPLYALFLSHDFINPMHPIYQNHNITQNQ